MALKKNANRQELIAAHIDIDHSDPTAYGTAENAFELPAGAVLMGGDVVVATAWNSATSATLKLGDAADDDRYTSTAIDLKAAGRTELTITGHIQAPSGFVRALLAQAGAAATQGKARITLLYYVRGRGTFTQG